MPDQERVRERRAADLRHSPGQLRSRIVSAGVGDAFRFSAAYLVENDPEFLSSGEWPYPVCKVIVTAVGDRVINRCVREQPPALPTVAGVFTAWRAGVRVSRLTRQ
jgi:hypothetical protein